MALGDADRETRLDAAIGEFLLAQEQGRTLDLVDWLDRYPDIADDLRAFLDDLTEVDRSIAALLPAPGMRYGHYRLLRILGRGSMGIVFEAASLANPGRKVAVKVLPACFLREPEDLDRFHREIEIAASLNHPNIVRLIDAETHRNTPFLTMERIDGVTFRKVVHDLRLFRRGRPTAASAYVVSLPEAPGDPIPLDLDGATSWPAVARIGMQAARALAFAHDRRVLHRDVKPSNLMLDRRGIVYLTDFGIARSDTSVDITETDEVGGSPRFMAPERFHRWCDARSDLYALGLTIYELLTLRPAFEYLDRARLIRAILTEEPRPPRRIDPTIPRDLETIVLKAMAKEPGGRYASAGEMADDFQRFLDGKPILAKPPTLLDLAARWSRRHVAATATAVALLFVAVVALSIGSALILNEQWKTAAAMEHAVRERHNAEAARTGAEREQHNAEAARKDADRRAIEGQLERIIGGRHTDGWSKVAEKLAREAALLGPDEKLRSLAATALGGIDVRMIEEFSFDTQGVAFDPEGKRLFMPGMDKGVQIWDVATGRIEVLDKRSKGPIVFRADGTPLVLTPTLDTTNLGVSARYPLELWNVEKRDTDRFLEDPFPGGSILKSWTLSADGSKVGAVSESPGGGRTLIAWDAADGRLLVKIPYAAEGLVFAPDASLLAAWDDSGHIDFWSMPDGKPVASLSNGTTPIHVAAFGPNHWRRGKRAPESPGEWLLAAGDRSGIVKIWDLATHHPRAICRGSQYDIMALGFSPDGTTLVSTGYSFRLWDVATGAELLDLNAYYDTSVAFSPDGARLAASHLPLWGSKGGAKVWELERNRGVRYLRGLPSPVEKAVFSPDGRLVAGLSHDWWLAVWDRAGGRLLQVLDAPRGRHADNAALTFSPDGRRLAFAAGHAARMWDIETGEEVGVWTLPEGFTDTLAFHGPDRLLLMRTETRDGKGFPYGDDPADHPSVRPRVETLRDLLGTDPAEPIRVIEDFNWEVHRIDAAPDGSRFVIEGLGGPEGKTRTINAYDVTGTRLWTLPSRKPLHSGADFHFDTSGKLLLLSMDRGEMSDLIDMRSREMLRTLSTHIKCMSAGTESWIVYSFHPHDSSPGFALHDRCHDGRIVQIFTNTKSGYRAKFSPDDKYTAWGNSDGSVTLCDWDMIRRRLNDIGLGW